MMREDILSRVKAAIEKHYDGDATKFKGVEVINFEVMDDNSLRIHVKVLFYGASTILHGRINDARDFGVLLTQDELDFLEETTAQETPRTRVARYVAHLSSQLRHVVSDDESIPSLTGALLSNPNLMDLIIHVDVDSIVSYVERILRDLACIHRTEETATLVKSLLSNSRLMSIIHHQGYIDEEAERSS